MMFHLVLVALNSTLCVRIIVNVVTYTCYFRFYNIEASLTDTLTHYPNITLSAESCIKLPVLIWDPFMYCSNMISDM